MQVEGKITYFVQVGVDSVHRISSNLQKKKEGFCPFWVFFAMQL
jgi:hypothetical protein